MKPEIVIELKIIEGQEKKLIQGNTLQRIQN